MANEKRLIDLDVAKKLFDYIPPFIGMTGKCVQEMLDEVPAVDAVEVVHGRWEYVAKTKDAKSGYSCSACFGPVWHAPDVPQAFLYCPNYGAKMDGGKADETDSV